MKDPWTARRSNQSILKEISPEYSLEGLMLKLKLQYFGHLMRRADSLEKTLMLGKIEGFRRRGWQRMRWWIASPTQWTWVWGNCGSWWWTGRPGVLQPMGSQRVGHDWATKLSWTELGPGSSTGKESESRSVVSDSLWPHGLYSPWNSPGQNTGVGSLSLLQGIFPTQGSNPGHPNCQQILYQLSHKRNPRVVKWVAFPFSRVSSLPRNGTGVSCIVGRFFTNWAMREAETGKESACSAGHPSLIPRLGRSPREELPFWVFWPGGFHGLYSPWGS